MRRILAFAPIFAAAAGLLPAQQPPLTNDDIIRMLKEGVSEDLIIGRIEGAGCDCDTSATAIQILNGAGASSRLVRAVMDAQKPPQRQTQAATRSQTGPTFFAPTKVTLFGGYSYGRSEGDFGGFNWNGFNAAVSVHVTDWLAVAGDISGHFTEIGGALDFSWFSFAAGPQFIRRTGRVRGFTHVLFGASRIDAGFLGFDLGNVTSFSTVLGGGIDVGLTERFAIRAFQGDWIRIWDIEGEDANLGRLSFGVVGRF